MIYIIVSFGKWKTDLHLDEKMYRFEVKIVFWNIFILSCIGSGAPKGGGMRI